MFTLSSSCLKTRMDLAAEASAAIIAKLDRKETNKIMKHNFSTPRTLTLSLQVQKQNPLQKIDK